MNATTTKKWKDARQTNCGRGREKKNMWCKNVLELEILDTDNRNQKNLTQNARNEV